MLLCLAKLGISVGIRRGKDVKMHPHREVCHLSGGVTEAAGHMRASSMEKMLICELPVSYRYDMR